MLNRVKESKFIYKWIMIIIALLIFIPNINASLTDGLEGYYTFDTNANDTYRGLRNMSYNGGTPKHITTDCKLGTGCYNFTGGIEADTLISGSYTFGTSGDNYTVSGWFLTRDITRTGQYYGEEFDILLQHTSEVPRFETGDGATKWEDTPGGAVNGGEVIADTWFYMTIIKNSSNRNLFINGTQVATTTWATSGVTPENFGLGCSFVSGTTGCDNLLLSLNGSIDEFGVWNRTLTQAEITQLYNQGVGFIPYTVANFTVSGLTDSFNSSAINIFNITMDNGTLHQYGTTTGSINTKVLQNATTKFNITVWKNNYLNLTYEEHNVSSLITSGTLDFNMSRHNISAYLAPLNTTLINNFTVNSSEGYSFNTTTGSLIFPTSWNTSIVLTFYGDEGNYSSPTFTVPGTANTAYNFSVYQTQTFYIEIWDEILNVILDYVTTTLDLISDDFGNNYTRTNGSYQLELLSPGDYIIRYDSADFFGRTYYQSLTDDSFNELTLYLLNSSYANAINVTANVINTVEEQLEGATITTTKYYSSSNSYRTVENTKTNFEGKASLSLTTDEYYIFQIAYGGETLLTTTPTYIFEEEITFVVDTGADPTTDYYNSYNIDVSLIFNNVTNNFVYTYSDLNSYSSANCLEVWKVNAFAGDTLENGSCSSSNTGTLLAGVTVINGTTYLGKAYATINGEKVLLASLYTEYKQDTSFGNMGLMIIIFMTITFALIGFWNPFISLLLTPIPLVFGAMMSIIAIPTGVAIGVWVAFVIIAISIGRNT